VSRPALEVADILRAQGSRFLERYQHSISYQQLKVYRAVLACRTASLGGHLDVCSNCGLETGVSFNSCRNRHCPKCQARAREQWLEARQQELLPIGYFHVVFTVPHELNVFALTSPRQFYDLLFAAASETLIEVARNPQRLGANIGALAILHTWGQNLLLHPHLHCVVPAGGLSPDRTRWIHTERRFLLPLHVLRKVFRGKFLDGLRRLHKKGRLCCDGPAAQYRDRKKFLRLTGPLYRRRWVVYAKKAMGGPDQVLRYLGRYTHRIAISNHRLLDFHQEHVTFRWKDYARGGKQRTMKLTPTEFLRRFFLHVLPKGFVRIRHFGPARQPIPTPQPRPGQKPAHFHRNYRSPTFEQKSSATENTLALSTLRRPDVCCPQTHSPGDQLFMTPQPSRPCDLPVHASLDVCLHSISTLKMAARIACSRLPLRSSARSRPQHSYHRTTNGYLIEHKRPFNTHSPRR